MSIIPTHTEARAHDATFAEGALCVHLTDGRTVTVPLSWYPKLRDAAPELRARWQLIGDGVGVHWPELDEDLSVQGILLGIRVTA